MVFSADEHSPLDAITTCSGGGTSGDDVRVIVCDSARGGGGEGIGSGLVKENRRTVFFQTPRKDRQVGAPIPGHADLDRSEVSDHVDRK